MNKKVKYKGVLLRIVPDPENEDCSGCYFKEVPCEDTQYEIGINCRKNMIKFKEFNKKIKLFDNEKKNS